MIWFNNFPQLKFTANEYLYNNQNERYFHRDLRLESKSKVDVFVSGTVLWLKKTNYIMDMVIESFHVRYKGSYQPKSKYKFFSFFQVNVGSWNPSLFFFLP